MGEVAGAIEILRRANPRHDLGLITMYANAWSIYREGQANIAEHGAVVANPRTGEAMANPYLQIVERQAKMMTALAKSAKIPLQTSPLWST